MTKYNSLIYLNDDFKGGEFFTRNGIKLKPQAGMLTLFDGSKVSHGLKKVKNKDCCLNINAKTDKFSL